MSHPATRTQRDYFDIASPSSSSPGSTPGLSAAEWSQQRPSLSGRYQPRRGSTASSIISAAGTLDGQSHNRNIGGLRELSQNAISTLLQPPIVRTGLLPHTSAPASSTHRPPSTRDIPPVTLTNIPHVDPSVFKPYLAQVGGLYEARARTEADEAATQEWQKKERRVSRGDGAVDSVDKRLRSELQDRPAASRQGSTASLAPLDTQQSAGKRRGSSSRRRLEVTPLSTIPGIYFDDNFHLENPRTFDIVSERSEVIRTPITASDGSKEPNGSANGTAHPPRKALATNAILQEKLSWYLDTVEIHLISSISSASQSFFAALGSLKELHSEAAESVTEIKKLREDLARLDKEMAVGGLEIVAMKQRRDNLRKLNESMDQLKSIVDGAAHCEELVEQGELEMALDRVSILEEYTCGRLRPRPAEETSWLTDKPKLQLRDLRRLRALNSFAEGMDQLRARVGKGYEARFMDALLTDLRKHITTVPNQDTLKRWASASLRARGHSSGPSVVPAYLHTDGALRQNLSVILNGLSRSKSLVIASAAFRDAIVREMKSLIRQHLPSSSDDDMESVASVSTTRSRAVTQQDKSARLARNLRNLGAEDAEELLMKIYCGVGEALRRLQTQVKVLLDVTSAQTLSPTTAGPRSPPKSPNMGSIEGQIKTRARSDSTPLQEELMQALDLSSLLGQAVDAAQTQITKILKVRAEQSTSLSLTYFLRYFNLNRLFADECEAVSGRSGAALKSVVNSQISEFIATMSRTEREQLERTMDTDQWAAKDFSENDNIVLKQVLQGMESDPQPWLVQAYVWEEIPVSSSTSSAEIVNGTSGTKEAARPAHIDEEKYVLVNSAIALLHSISRFQTLIACIPSLFADVSAAIVEHLRFFNSRSCQLVLGAGATRSTAALPNINTKHLALASQALSFVVALTPYVREFIRRRSSAASSVAEYDKTRMLYYDHISSITDKLIEIMAGRASKHVKLLSATDFDSPEESGREVGRYMETLCKETVVLQRTLGRYLPAHQVEGVMKPVFVSYKEQFGAGMRGVKLASEAGKARLARDAQYFNTKLGAIEGADNTGPYLINIAKEKHVAVPAKPASMPAPVPTTPATKTAEDEKASETDKVATEQQSTEEKKGDGDAGDPNVKEELATQATGALEENSSETK